MELPASVLGAFPHGAMPSFENQQQLARDQANVVNNCWSEGSYELGVEALNAFRKGERRYPSPSHIRHLLALALYPPENITQPLPRNRSPTTPRKKSVARSRPLAVSAPLSPAHAEIPTCRASQLALELLTALAATTHPAHLTAGLSSYARSACDASDFDSIVSTGKIDTFKSPLAGESVRVGRARDCWAMVRDGFLLPKDGATSTAQPKWVDGDDIDLSEDEDNHKSSYVASHAWGVVDWWIKLFETDQAINSAELGSASPSKLLLSHMPPASRTGAPQNDIQTALGVAFSALRSDSEQVHRLGLRLLTLFINASATYAISPGILVQATADQLPTLTGSAFKKLSSHLTGLVELPSNSVLGFPTHLYYRFCFYLASCHLSKTGTGVASIGTLGGVTDFFTGRGPKARPTVRTATTGEDLAAAIAQKHPVEPYPSPSLEGTLALLRSTPSVEGLKPDLVVHALTMHAVARLAIIQSFEKLSAYQNTSPWISDNEMASWRVGMAQNVRLGFEADLQAGVEGLENYASWAQTRNLCQILCND